MPKAERARVMTRIDQKQKPLVIARGGVHFRINSTLEMN